MNRNACHIHRLNNYHSIWWYFSYFFFAENWLCHFHANCLLGGQFAWNVKAYFLGKIFQKSNLLNFVPNLQSIMYKMYNTKLYKLTLKRQEKLHLKMLSVYVVYCIFLQTFKTYFCIQANSVDPDQTAPRGAVWSGSTLFAKMTFRMTSRWQSRRQ